MTRRSSDEDGDDGGERRFDAGDPLESLNGCHAAMRDSGSLDGVEGPPSGSVGDSGDEEGEAAWDPLEDGPRMAIHRMVRDESGPRPRETKDVVLTIPDRDDDPDRHRELDRRARRYHLESRPVAGTGGRDKGAVCVELMALDGGEMYERERFDPAYRAGRGEGAIRWFRTLMEAGSNVVLGTPWRAIKVLSWDMWRPAQRVTDYADILPYLHRPKLMGREHRSSRPCGAREDHLVFESDRCFVEDRLWGANPMLLERWQSSQWPSHWPRAKLRERAGLDLEALAARGTLYVSDHWPLLQGHRDARPARHHWRTGERVRVCPRPTTWFERVGEGSKAQLIPRAIRIDTGPEPGDGVVVPAPRPGEAGAVERIAWAVAKTCVGTADAVTMEMHYHLGHYHFWTERVYVATESHFHSRHPIGALLREHLRFVAANNRFGELSLIQKHGPIDRLLGLSRSAAVRMTRTAVENFRLLESYPERDLRRRGLDGDRDWNLYARWSQDIWSRIERFAQAWVAAYYGSGRAADGAVASDTELAAWARKLASMHADRDAFPAKIETVGRLVEVLAAIIYHASAGHSIVNFGQWESLGSVPSMPLAIWADYRGFFRSHARGRVSAARANEFRRRMLPPMVRAIDQSVVVAELTGHRHLRLGAYPWSPASSAAKRAMGEFAEALATIEREVDGVRQGADLADSGRFRRPFEHLAPSSMINSPSI